MTNRRRILFLHPKAPWAAPLALAAVACVGLISALSAEAQLLGGRDPRPAVAQAAARGEYIGHLKCEACHFSQYESWKASPHGEAFNILPTKYRKDASCLECHAPSATPADRDPNLASQGVSCEGCHGPGEQHTKLALTFVERGITDEGLERLRSLIELAGTHLCIGCHVRQAHKPHPEFDPDPNQAGARATTGQTPTGTTGSFFRFNAHGKRGKS